MRLNKAYFKLLKRKITLRTFISIYIFIHNVHNTYIYKWEKGIKDSMDIQAISWQRRL